MTTAEDAQLNMPAQHEFRLNAVASLIHELPISCVTEFIDDDYCESYRTVVRKVDMSALSAEDLAIIDELFELFNKMKRIFIQEFMRREWRRFLIGVNDWWDIRDALVLKKYQPPVKLQDRHWKLALHAAAVLVRNYWLKARKETRVAVYKEDWYRELPEPRRKYVDRILSKLDTPFFDVMDGRSAPFVDGENSTDIPNRWWLCERIRTVANRVKGRYPVSTAERSVWFDEGCWSTGVKADPDGQKNVQFIRLMTTRPWKRVRVPLMGMSTIRSKVMLIKTHSGCLYLHVLFPLDKKRVLQEPVGVPAVAADHWYCESFDLGYTEVYTNSKGERFGVDFGKKIAEKAEILDQILRGRNQFYALMENSNDPERAKRIRKCNLGDKRFKAFIEKLRKDIERIVNEAINQMMKVCPAHVWIVEEFGDSLFCLRKFSKKTRRMLTNWIRGFVEERLNFKATVNGIKIARICASYSSQCCPSCRYTVSTNRNGDRFKCKDCGETRFTSDQVGAMNLLYRAANEKWAKIKTKGDAWKMTREEYSQCCLKFNRNELPDPKLKAA